jgi:hypothetical protein
MSRSSVASIALVAAAVAGAVMWFCKNERARRPAHAGEVTRWEGEGGNVPDVAVENGNQAEGKTGKPAVASSSPSVSKSGKSDTPADKTDSTSAKSTATGGSSDNQGEEPWPFPRS